VKAADVYPSKHVTIITHVAPGSGPDVISRVVADRLAQIWGRQATIINRQGAAGLIAGQAAAKAPPDGYTLFLPTISGLVISPEIQPKFPVDFERDFAPIGIVGVTPMMIAVAPALGVNTLAEFVALAKKRPGEILYAGTNRGSFPHLTGELIRSKAVIDIGFVSYPGATGALQDIMGGRIAMMIESPSALSDVIEQGVLKALAVTSAARLPNFPNVPTASETVPDFLAIGWFALLAPTGTPDEIVHKINQDLKDVLRDASVQQRFETLGVYARAMSASETSDFIRRERELWRPVIHGAGLVQ
jgi:tripartite-type tricarboxylate transporter receptor subunit TctC